MLIPRQTIAVIGGDKRMLYAAQFLKQNGFVVLLFGFNEDYAKLYNLPLAKSLQETLSKSNIVLLPLPCTGNDETLNTPLYDGTITLANLFTLIIEKQTLFAGKINNKIMDGLVQNNVSVFDYTNREEFSVLNAIPTAEGALQIAMENTVCTLNGTQCLVTGFGRIAKVLAHYLQGLGADVSICARKPSDLAWMRAYGYPHFPIKELTLNINDYDIIFNTVPECIFTDKVLQETKKDALIIDLASKPGGAGVFLDKKNTLCTSHRVLKILLTTLLSF